MLMEVDVPVEDVVRSWVVQALSSASTGNHGYCNKLLSDLKNVEFDDPSSLAAFSIKLKALAHSATYIGGPFHHHLVTHILNMSFWNCPSEIAESLYEFVINLATSNGAMLPKCLDMLARNFLPPSCGNSAYIDCYTADFLARKKITIEDLRNQQGAHLSRKYDVLDRVHSAIQKIIEYVPTVALRLDPVVIRRMPHRSFEKQWLALYMESMLRLESNNVNQVIGRRMLLAIVDKLIEIDVQIEWEDILKDDEKVYLFHMDVDDNEEKQVEPCPGSEAVTEYVQSKSRITLGEAADKMDVLMDMMFDHLQSTAKRGRAYQMYMMLMQSFQSTILATYKSKFTQFLMFYLCSLDPDTCGSKFASFLCDTFVSTSESQNTRMAAAAYLASYIARANFLPLSVISDTIVKLVKWCLNYSPSVFHGFRMSDVGLYSVFYSGCQAVMYGLCFRLRELLNDTEQRAVVKNMGLQQFVEHKLNPLRVCLPSVVEEFVRQASASQLVSSKNRVETNRSLELLSSKAFGGDHRLDMLFPFDPYLLSISDRFIRPNYIFWTRPEEDGEDGEEEEEEEEHHHSDVEDELEEEEEEVVVASGEYRKSEYDADDDIFRSSMEFMSITPPRLLLPAKLNHAFITSA